MLPALRVVPGFVFAAEAAPAFLAVVDPLLTEAGLVGTVGLGAVVVAGLVVVFEAGVVAGVLVAVDPLVVEASLLGSGSEIGATGLVGSGSGLDIACAM